MRGPMRIRVSGLKEMDRALAELSKTAARNVLRRALVSAAEPMRAAAEQNAPKLTGKLKRSIILSSKIDNRAGKKEYAAVMRGGGTKGQAVQALRDARRAKGIGESFAEVQLGPEKSGKRDAIKAVAQEFGSVHHPAQPYLRPAFDAYKVSTVERVRGEIKTELNKSIARARARALKAGK